MNVEFGFSIDQKVFTPFGDEGIISMAAVDDGRNIQYFVKARAESNWFKEGQLKAV